MPDVGTFVNHKVPTLYPSHNARNGHIRRMANNLKRLRRKAGLSQPALAERMGTTKNQYIKLENGTRQLTLSWIEKAAEALNVEAGGIVSEPKEVTLVGRVRAGAEAYFYGTADDPNETVDAPEGATESTVAVEVEGESLGALFDHWLIFYDDVRRPVTEDLIGRLCIVGLTDDRIMVKKIKKSRTHGLFHLLSNTEEPILDVAIEWAARVITMTPK